MQYLKFFTVQFLNFNALQGKTDLWARQNINVFVSNLRMAIAKRKFPPKNKILTYD